MTAFLAAAVAMIQVKGGSSGALGALLMTWALSLPVALFLHAVLPLPPPQGPHPYGLHPNWDKERAQAGRQAHCCSIFGFKPYMYGISNPKYSPACYPPTVCGMYAPPLHDKCQVRMGFACERKHYGVVLC